MAEKTSDKHYIRRLEAIKTAYQESKDWGKVIATATFSDTHEGNEQFIDYVEIVYKTKVKDSKHLQELTGIKDLDTLEDILLKAKICNYERALYTALENRAKYKDLLEIDPQSYGLPNKWEEGWGDKANTILHAIALFFHLQESIHHHASLREIAKEIEAPYSVVMDAFSVLREI